MSAAHESRPAAAHGSPLVFVVDDEPVSAEIVAELLQLAGYRTRVFNDPRVAVEELRRSSVKPDVLLLDEVLSTGDAAFREKSRARIVELMHKAHAIVYVTHDLESAAKFCTKAIEIEEGRIVASGPTQQVVDAYIKKMDSKR